MWNFNKIIFSINTSQYYYYDINYNRLSTLLLHVFFLLVQTNPTKNYIFYSSLMKHVLGIIKQNFKRAESIRKYKDINLIIDITF